MSSASGPMSSASGATPSAAPTNRLYYTDSYLRDGVANIVAVEGRDVYLDQTVFYPASGGQPCDLGTINQVRVLDVSEDEAGRILHQLETPLEVGGQAVSSIDWRRRFDHMQQHTGQHLLSAAFESRLKLATLSFHMGPAVSTIELSGSSLSPADIEKVENYANEIVCENRPVLISFEHAQEAAGLRKASDRDGVLRIVTIDQFDRSACGGTHVKSTAEIGLIQIRKLDKVRGNVRVEFVCGLRAVRRARQDFDALTAIARSFSSSIDETPKLVATQVERLQELDKAHRKTLLDLAQARGRALYSSAACTPSGLRSAVEKGPITEDTRATGQAFTAGPLSAFLAVSEDPPAILLATSKDSGLNAGDMIKKAVTTRGGRGGGSPQVAQGSLPTVEALGDAVKEISSAWAS